MGIEEGSLLSREAFTKLKGEGRECYFQGKLLLSRGRGEGGGEYFHLLSRVSLVSFLALSLVISLTRLLGSYSTMNEIHLASLRTLASQAGVMVDVVCAMRSILPAYHTSYHYAKAVFLSFIEQAGR